MMERRAVIRALGIVGLFAAFSAVMTWPQAWYLSSRATQHHDVYFNMWRLRWFAHAIVTPGVRLFDANIFFPEPRTLALSDAMLVEGAFAAPFQWLGANPVLVHNLTLLAGITLSGVAMFALARYLTGSAGAGVIAGIVFAYAPYRFEHFMHMELQWAVWSPLAFLALHLALDTGRARYGVALGACIALQMLSSIYYGIFLGTLAGVAAVLSVPCDRTAPLKGVVKGLAAGAMLAAVVCALYARPYLQTHDRVGDRPDEEVSTYSASPRNYLAATAGNWLYGSTALWGRPERHLFPGATPVILAIVGLLLRVPRRRTLLYLILFIAAFEASLGPRGFSYMFLRDHVIVYGGLRAAARLGIFVLLFLAALAAYGYQALAEGRSRAWRIALCGLCVAALLAEYRTTVLLVPYPYQEPPIYQLLGSQPKGVVAEFPTPRGNSLPAYDPQYAYMSTFHWFPLVNGYSGFYPTSYLARLDRLDSFPSQTSLIQLRRDTVRYVIVHTFAYKDEELKDMEIRIEQSGALAQLGRFRDADAEAWLYRVR